MLLSASLDGTVMVWDPSTSLPKGAEKEVPSKHTIKAHADGVLSMALFQAAVDTPDAQPLQLCTTGPLHTVCCASCMASWLLYLTVLQGYALYLVFSATTAAWL